MPLSDIPPLSLAQSLGTALAIGLFVGLERGWQGRSVREGGRVAGLRTFALIGLLGGVLGLLSPGPGWLAGAGLVGVALLFAVSFNRAARALGTVSITTAVAALATYGLGLLAAQGEEELAVGAAVVMTLLLGSKHALHGWLRGISPPELNAVLQLAVLSAVILPLLPDAALGPYGAINPFKAWLAVVVVSALSLAGHVAVRLRGPRQGLMWTGLLGGLASSTATTLALSRLARERPALGGAAAAAVLASCGVMFLRLAAIVGLLQPALAWRLAALLVVPALVCLAAAALAWPRAGPAGAQPPCAMADKPLFPLSSALGFGLVLVVVGLVARAARQAVGDSGLNAVALVSGLADVDAIAISVLQMHARDGLPLAATAAAMGLAAASNLVVKAAMAWSLAGRQVGLRVAAGFLAAAVAGGVLLVLLSASS